MRIILSIFRMFLSFVVSVGVVVGNTEAPANAVYYDLFGNEYTDVYEVPLYDDDGNTYVYASKSFFDHVFIDQDGTEYSGDYCYLDKNGRFYYDMYDRLEYYNFDYYTDGENLYYWLGDVVYWDSDGNIFANSGEQLFK